MTLDEIVSLVQTAAEVAAFLGVPYASDVAAAAGIAPEVIADAQDAISRIKSLFPGIPPLGDSIGFVTEKHIAALTTFHTQWTSYAKLGRNPIDVLPAAQ